MPDLWGDLKSARLMCLKAILFLVAGSGAAAGILLENFHWRTALLLGIAIWSFCRLYYFAFYVIEKYIDPGYRFAGLHSFLLYLLRDRPKERPRTNDGNA
jgi:uncharacterized RDD family membrane protein YckC